MRSGHWVVLGLLLVGVAMGTVTVRFWSWQGQPTPPSTREHDGAGAAPWDEGQARLALEPLQEQFNRIAGDNQPATGMLDEVRGLVEHYPRYDQARTLLAQVLLYQDQLEPAYDQLRLSLELNGQQPHVHILAGTLAIKLGRVDNGVGHYSDAVGLEPTNPRFRLHLALGYLRQHQQGKARMTLLEALKIDSSMHEAYAQLADLFADQGKTQLAMNQINQALEHTPPTQRSHRVAYTRRKAQLLRRSNQPEQAMLILQSLTAREQDQPWVLQDMALCWSMLGQPDQAALLYENALGRNPSHWPLLVQAIHWRLKTGDKPTALQHIKTLRRHHPPDDVLAQLQEEIQAAP